MLTDYCQHADNGDMITKAQAIQLFGSVRALQAALGLKTHSAIYMWKDGEAIPENHYLRIRYELMPESFDTDGNLRPEASEEIDPARRGTAAKAGGAAEATGSVLSGAA